MSEVDLRKTDVAGPRAPNAPPPGLELLEPLLCLIGLCVATYLCVLHYSLMLGDLSLGGVCGGGTWGDCNSVVASRYGKLLGLPVSIWGMWYYLCAGTLSLALLMLRKEDAVPFVRALIALTAAALLFDVYLAWAMWRHLGRLCPLCVVTYALNVSILLIALRYRRRIRAGARSLRSLLPSLALLFRPQDPMYYREVLKTFLGAVAGASCLVVLGLAVSVSRAVVDMDKEKLARLLEYVRVIEPFHVPTQGRPSRGPDDASITVVVFSDFLCEQCKLGSRYLDIVAANHRDSLRLVYMHYPVDDECNEYAKANMHPGACKLAQAAECAHRQDRFWEYHDLVFGNGSMGAADRSPGEEGSVDTADRSPGEEGRVDTAHRSPGKAKPDQVTAYATLAGLDIDRFKACMAGAESAETVQADIALARSLGTTATPTLYVNGRPLVGAVKPWMLEAAIEAIAPLPLPTVPAGSDNE